MTYPAFKLSHLEEKEPYLYDDCGLDGIYLLNGYEVGKDEHDEWDSIHNIFGLHKAIALYLARQERVLIGAEVAFCRKTLEMTQVELADLIRKEEQAVARWEKGKVEIPATE